MADILVVVVGGGMLTCAIYQNTYTKPFNMVFFLQG
jgi:hypothetical protein